MGEIADMMINGDLCEGCGVAMGTPGEGYPRYCKDCKRQSRTTKLPSKPMNGKIKCTQCLRWVKPTGMKQHLKNKHGVGS